MAGNRKANGSCHLVFRRFSRLRIQGFKNFKCRAKGLSAGFRV